GNQWFTAPAPAPEGLYFPGFGADDANPDMGDSAIIETLGLGGFAMAAAPAVIGFLGLPGAKDASSITRSMAEITIGQSAQFKIPALDFDGTPTGIDIRRVARLEVTPLINTGIAHRQAGVGQIGAGVVRAPLAVFQQALEAFSERYASEEAGAMP
ncbi:MAG: oxamate carbamoyltransferase subunit AllG family protein, partial [Armatimonadota bacterium]